MSLNANEEVELISLLEQEQRERAKEHLLDFLQLDGGDCWVYGEHIEAMCEALERVEAGTCKRLMIFMPPRHGKSETVSKKFPAWALGRNPDKEVILASYGADLANDHSRIARATFERWGKELWGVEKDKRSDAVNRWGIEGHRGGMRAVGVRGSCTGRGANWAIIDDPVKDYAEAHSPVYREAAWQWYRSTLRTRLAKGGAIVFVGTRWHEDDLGGRLLKAMAEGGEQWEIISFPAIANDEYDELGRDIGEALWPAMFDLPELESIHDSLGAYLWSALYDQTPTNAEGMKFKRSWFRYFREELIPSGGGFVAYWLLKQPDGREIRYEQKSCWTFQTIDAAATEKEASDYFVCATWDVTPRNDLLLRGIFREKAETTKHMEIMRQQYDRWQPGFQGVENATYGLNIIQACIVAGLPVRPLAADKDKLARSLPAQARFEVGAIYFDPLMPELPIVESELIDFPSGVHDDIVDTVSYAAIQIASANILAVITGIGKREHTDDGRPSDDDRDDDDRGHVW